MNLKKLIFPQQKYIEGIIKRYAIYYPDKEKVKIAPMHKIFPQEKLLSLSAGIQARVFKHQDYPWVIKEGRWDLEFDFIGTGKISFNAMWMDKIMNLFSHSFLPRLDEILRQYKYYLTMAQYFGFFADKNSIYHPNHETILAEQRHIRNSLMFYKPEIEKRYKFKINDKIDSILLSDIRFHNFLPKEYLLYGKSISPENKDNYTYYIVQEYIDGYNLDKVDETELPPHLTKQLILLLYLILLMDHQVGLLPDTRPKYLITQMYDWLLNTDNIRVTKKDIKFIDTRWLWDTKANLIKRGIFLPELIRNLAKGYINYLLEKI